MAKLNPVFSGIKVEEGIETAATFKGVSLKTVVLLGIAVISAIMAITFGYVFDFRIYLFALLGALVAGIVGQVSYKAAPIASVIYAALEGIVLGALSSIIEGEVSGIVLSAVLTTFTIFGVMLLLYSTNIIRVNGRFMRVMSVIGISILVISLIYLISFLINADNILVTTLQNQPSILLLVSGLILLYGAFMLAIDFEQAKAIVVNGFDKRYEWVCALGLIVTLVWIYIEVLRILLIFSKRD